MCKKTIIKTILKVVVVFKRHIIFVISPKENKHEFIRIRSKYTIVKNQMSEQHCNDFEEFFLKKTKIVSFLDTD